MTTGAGKRRRKSVACACGAAQGAVHEGMSWDGRFVQARLPATVRRFTLPSAEVSPDEDCEELRMVKSDFDCGARKPGRAIRHAFNSEAGPRRVKKLAHGSGCDELPAALLEMAFRLAQGHGVEFGALEVVSEARPVFLREPWERHPQ